MGYKLIVAATDFSAGAETAFALALELAAQYAAQLVVAHVIPPLITPSPLLDDLVVAQVSQDLRHDLAESAQRHLQTHYLEKAQARGVRAEAVILEGDPPRELVDLVSQRRADLLVVGAMGLTGLAEIFFGSVAAKAVRRAPCSVLVARPSPAGS
jgi:nucleotide-binding universal stress UspA family protein